jgi:6-phosphogluconolactonase
MKRISSQSVFIAAVVIVAAFLATASLAEEPRDSKRVYLMTNDEQNNTIIIFERAGDGTLSRSQEISTGGRGAGFGTLPAFLPPAPGPNPLQSQDSVISTEDGRFILAVNAGSNELSVMAVTSEGLRLVSKVLTGGIFPVSVAIHKDLVYVLNEGDDASDSLGGTPNINGFHLDMDGNLHPIEGSTRAAGTNPSHPGDIIVSPDGDMLVITEKFTDRIDAFRIDQDGQPGERLSFPSNNVTPFGLAFGKHGVLTITETNSFLDNGRRNAVPGGSTMSSYRVTDTGELQPISRAVPNHQTAVCWVRFTPDGRFAYTSNKGSGSISLYGVSPDGNLTLLQEVAADTGGFLSGPIDMALSRDGRFLYVIASFVRELRSYRIEPDGSLEPLQIIYGLPLPAQGIVAE